MIDARRLQRHLRDTMRRQSPATRIGPFTCFLHPSSAHGALNVAIPDAAAEGRRVPIMGEEASGHAAVPDDDAAYALVLVKAHYAANRRVPRVELLEEAAPALGDALRAQGFVEEARVPLLACTRETWRAAKDAQGLRVEPVLATSPWHLARQYLLVQREAYDLDMPVPDRAPPGHWEALQLGAGLLAFRGSEPIGAGGFTPLDDGLCDVRGLGVRPAHRGQGVGAFLLSALARVAHEAGAEAITAIPDGPETERLAERAGFRRAATLLSFRAEGAAGP